MLIPFIKLCTVDKEITSLTKHTLWPQSCTVWFGLYPFLHAEQTTDCIYVYIVWFKLIAPLASSVWYIFQGSWHFYFGFWILNFQSFPCSVYRFMINRALGLRPHVSGYFWKRRFFSPYSKKKYRFCASTLKRWNDVYTITSFYRACATYDTDNSAFSKISTMGNVFKSLRFWCQKTPFTRERKAKTEKEISIFKQKRIRVDIFFACGCAKNDSNTLHVDTLSPDMCGRDLIILYLTNESG